MAQYEHLLSIDPIGALDKITDDYLRYFKTMYRFEGKLSTTSKLPKYSSLDDKKNELLKNGDNLAKEPYCELMPKYQLMADDLMTLCSSDGEYSEGSNRKLLPKDFADFIKKGLMGYRPYKHQFEMLCKGYGEGNDVLITSGTGSGKTESFLLPLFASLLDEATRWNAPERNYNHMWWKRRDDAGKYVANQRDGETRPDAIRAILLYPMNALVADQVSRLRKALDSDDIRNFLDTNCNGNRIFFGSYNGRTLKSKDEETANKLETMANQANALKDSACEPDDIYVSPRLSDSSFTSEMLVREDMQKKCPDILITNISMLNIMLMRAEEQSMLDRTKEYYKKNKDAVFHLIIDELHLHRGTAGAEVAYLLRMFLDRIGVPPMKDGKKNPQLRIYASSASIDSAEKYLEDFFGVYDPASPFVIQKGYDIYPAVRPGLVPLDYGKFDIFFLNNTSKKEYYEQDENERKRTEREFLDAIGYSGSFSKFVEDYSGQIYLDLKNLTTSDVSTFPLSKMESLNGRPSKKAIRGFFIFRGTISGNENLPSIRFHQFYRYIDGLWGELLPDKDTDAPIGEVIFHPEEVSSNGKHKVLELLRCECCGELFIGGNRAEFDNGNRVVLSLNSPDLERIPNMQSTPMVQRKNINDYALFWPNKEPVLNGWYSDDPQNMTYERFGVVNCQGDTTEETGNAACHGAWKKGYLNPFDGSVVFSIGPTQMESVGNYISGFLYTPRNNRGDSVTEFKAKVLKALPCKCPACEKDYRTRLYTKSPIRSFRTGMGRNNQIFSKELLYQLDANGNHAPKLIGFSDSRQDAAEQSKLIAREHYRDMLRLAFITIITRKSSGTVSTALSNLKGDIISSLDTMDHSRIELYFVDNNNEISTSEKDAIKRILGSGKSSADIAADLNAYTPDLRYIDLDKLISKSANMIDGELVSELVRLGINPAGSEYSDMYPTNTGDYWDTLYDFSSEQMIPRSYRETYGRTECLGEIVYKSLCSNIFSNCFGQYMNVNTEAAGLGYVASKDITGIQEVTELDKLLSKYLTSNVLTIEEVLNAFIRIYGDNYRYDGDFVAKPMRNYSDFSSQIKKVVKSLAQKASVKENALGQALCMAMTKIATDENGKLDLHKPLRFVLSHSQDPYYKCPKCGRVHLHRGMGICTNTSCRYDLPKGKTGIVDDLWRDNYISYDVKEQPHQPRRIHSEELTGQTDDQTSRLLCFKDIILGGEPIARAIDMLSVTTTMEVGVDIGSLQAIYQGNMPPTRYNYQQRVGRAGRRGQAFSAAITFCRGRSHDNYYYYQATEQITGGKPANPTISVNPMVGDNFNPVILKRIILKHILMIVSAPRADWAVDGGTSGQLGGKGSNRNGNNWTSQTDWSTAVKPEIDKWIKANESTIEEIIQYYTSQFIPKSDNSLNKGLLDWIQNNVLNEIDEAINKSTQSDNALAITEAGLLPMYGMPSTVRNLYHNGTRTGNGYREIESFNGIIDRPIEQSITEFAPGAVKTKDAAEYQSAGLTVPLENNLSALYGTNDLDPLEHSYNLNMKELEIDSIDAYNPQLIDPDKHDTVRLVIPKAFRTDKLFNNKGEFRQEDDSRSNFSPVNTWVKADSTVAQTFVGGTILWEVWNGDNKKGDVWYVNTNNGEFFRGWRAAKIVQNKTFEPKYYSRNVTPADQDTVIASSPNFMIEPFFKDQSWIKAQNDEIIALGAKKVTDILCLSFNINSIPNNLNLNAHKGNKPAIIAAMYSAATLIQRTFADDIDIQPEEIEISEVKIDRNNGLPSVYLNDKAPNGAGFISLLCKVDSITEKTKLQEIMEDIVSPTPKSNFIQSVLNHKNECKTSCPKCLNTFYNRGLHHILDWRLGMDIIKLMLDKNYDMGYYDLAGAVCGDLAKVLNELGDRTQQANPIGNIEYHQNDGHDWRKGYFTTSRRGTTIIEHLVHPLWNIEKQELDDKYKAQDSFTLQRLIKKEPHPIDVTAVSASIPSTSSDDVNQPKVSTDQPVPGNSGYGELG